MRGLVRLGWALVATHRYSFFSPTLKGAFAVRFTLSTTAFSTAPAAALVAILSGQSCQESRIEKGHRLRRPRSSQAPSGKSRLEFLWGALSLFGTDATRSVLWGAWTRELQFNRT